MGNPFRLALFLGVALLLTPHVVSTKRTTVAKASLELKPCQVRDVKGDAKCGTLAVFENRATRKGRQINLNIVVLPATGQPREPDPVFYFAGGPGSAATEAAAGIAQVLRKVRERRDLVFVDQRGTGNSNPLNCKLVDPSDQQNYLSLRCSGRPASSATAAVGGAKTLCTPCARKPKRFRVDE